MDIDDFFSNNFGNQGRDFYSAGPEVQRLYQAIGHESHTDPYVASVFWRAFINSPAYDRSLARAGASPIASTRGEAFVIRHGAPPRYDLAVFDPGTLNPGKGFADVTPDELRIGWANSVERSIRTGGSHLADPLLGLQAAAAVEISSQDVFGVMVMPAPPLLFTAFASAPALSISLGPGIGHVATAGVVATDSHGRNGVTTARHALTSLVPLIGAHFDVAGYTGTVVAEDAITDSCFVEVPGLLAVGNGQAGPLRGLTPRNWEKVTFEGSVGRTQTVVTGWSPELPVVLQGSQLKVLTKAVTVPGDSGAALVDSSDQVLGFSFYRTGFGVLNEFAAWIWAESVYDTYGLK